LFGFLFLVCNFSGEVRDGDGELGKFLSFSDKEAYASSGMTYETFHSLTMEISDALYSKRCPNSSKELIGQRSRIYKTWQHVLITLRYLKGTPGKLPFFFHPLFLSNS